METAGGGGDQRVSQFGLWRWADLGFKSQRHSFLPGGLWQVTLASGGFPSVKPRWPY